jgi:hypothetical protein
MGFPKTGYTSKSAESFIIDAATIFSDVTYTPGTGENDGEFNGTPLGATSGGVTINIEQTYRKPEVDGTYLMDVVGLEFMEGAKCTITANLKELTAENLRRSLNGTIRAAEAGEAPTGYQVVESKRYVEQADYIENMAVVGIHNGTKKPIIFWLSNGLVTSPLNLATEDNNEAVVEQSIVAHATVEQLTADEFPWKIFYPGTPTQTEPASIPITPVTEEDTEE